MTILEMKTINPQLNAGAPRSSGFSPVLREAADADHTALRLHPARSAGVVGASGPCSYADNRNTFSV